MSPTTTIGAASRLDPIESIARSTMDSIGDRTLLSQARCADILLDLYGATDDCELRGSILERLRELRHVNTVLADELRADLEAITEIAATLRCLDRTRAEQLISEPHQIPAATARFLSSTGRPS